MLTTTGPPRTTRLAALLTTRLAALRLGGLRGAALLPAGSWLLGALLLWLAGRRWARWPLADVWALRLVGSLWGL